MRKAHQITLVGFVFLLLTWNDGGWYLPLWNTGWKGLHSPFSILRLAGQVVERTTQTISLRGFYAPPKGNNADR